MNAVERVLVALVEIKGARAHGVLRPRPDIVGHFQALLDLGGRSPGRPFAFAADLGHAGKGHRVLADCHAVADRLAAVHHVVEIARVGIDHDRAGQLAAVIVDDVALIGLGDDGLFVGRRGQKLLVARGQIGLRRRLDGRLHAAAEH